MVNDQLIRVHQLKQLLAYEKMNSKLDQVSIDDRSNQYNQLEIKDQQNSYDQRKLSFTNNSTNHEDQQPAQTQQTPASVIKTKTSPSLKERVLLKKQNSSSSSNSNQSSKRRSSWRNLINPNYKSRSDEFHKIFCDRIPKTERLIADYACALHREILIQGRVYISINYLAFYSNLFGWITKLVVRLRDISEIFKANTARIIPNAIQIITTSGEKHVLASLVARDKTYVMLLRIWQNNQMRDDRMTDQEIRNLVYYGYGKDLGMSDNEELKINSPDPVTPANIPMDIGNHNPSLEDRNLSQNSPNPISSICDESPEVDKNNNSHSSQRSISPNPLSESLDLSHQQVSNCDDTLIGPEGTNHYRYNSVDLNEKVSAANQDCVIGEVVDKLNELKASHASQDLDLEDGLLANTYSPAASSAIILDTPPGPYQQTRRSNKEVIDNFEPGESPQRREKTSKADVSDIEGQNRHSLGASSTETRVAADLRSGHDDNYGFYGMRHSDGEDQLNQVQQCNCEEHIGQLIADQEFDINIDTLFTLIFTNSKFMRTYMIRRGMTDAIISGWKRSNNGSDKQNASAVYDVQSRGKDGVSYSTTPKTVHTKQIRQLNYSMSIDHLWAKQVQVEERQNICQVRPGVYVLKSETINSGIPYGETFTVDTSYCLTRNGDINKSKMVVYSFVNFNKEKQNWRLAMVKSMIERQSMQGVKDFIDDLTSCIKEYINKTIEQRNDVIEGGDINDKSNTEMNSMKQESETLIGRKGITSQSNAANARYHYHCNSLTRAKSKLKERKLRNMYRYYIRNADEDGLEEGNHFNRVGTDDDDSDKEDFDGLNELERLERRRARRKVNRNRPQHRQYRFSDGLSENIETSWSSSGDSDLDDNGSMIMMMRATDDQVSDAASLSLRGVTDGAVWSQMDRRKSIRMERSFSDVDESVCFRATNKKNGFLDDGEVSAAAAAAGNNCSQKERQQRRPDRSANDHDTDNRQTRSLPQKMRLYRAAGIVTAAANNGNGNGSLQASNNVVYGRQQKGEWCPFAITDGMRKHWAAFGVKTLGGFLLVTLLITLFSMIVSHVMILRRLESLEARLIQMKCEQQEPLSLEAINRDSGNSENNNKW